MSKIAGYKINKQTLVALLYTNGEQPEKGFKIISLAIPSKMLMNFNQGGERFVKAKTQNTPERNQKLHK